MSVIYIVVPVALLIVIGMLIAFFRSVKQGQFDDLDTPAIRMLFEDDPVTSDKVDEKDPGA
jgi:cbb3-type cytochrome oxidase maturation protein